VNAIHKGVVHLYRERKQCPSVPFEIPSPVEQRCGIVPAAGIGVGNVGKGYPWKCGELEDIIPHGAGEIFLLILLRALRQGDVFLQGIFHPDIYNLKKLRIRIQIREGRVDPVKHNGLAVHKAAAEFFDSVGTVRNSVDEGKGKGIPLFPDCGEKIGDIQFKADTVLRLGAVSENLVVKGPVPGG